LKLFSDRLSLIAIANEIAKLGHVGDEWRNDNAVAPPPAFPTCASFVMVVGTEISEGLSLISFKLTASSALASGLSLTAVSFWEASG
jgi:hypothetical protein